MAEEMGSIDKPKGVEPEAQAPDPKDLSDYSARLSFHADFCKTNKIPKNFVWRDELISGPYPILDIYIQRGVKLDEKLRSGIGVVAAFVTQFFRRLRWPIPYRIRLCLASVRLNSTIAPAWALPKDAIVYLNMKEPEWSKEDQRNTIAHEMGHVFWLRHVKRKIPAWLEEGLACVLEREWNRSFYHSMLRIWHEINDNSTRNYKKNVYPRLATRNFIWSSTSGRACKLHDSGELAVYYLRSLGFTKYIRFLKAVLLDNRSVDNQLRKYFGFNTHDLERHLQVIAKNRTQWKYLSLPPIGINIAFIDQTHETLLGLVFRPNMFGAAIINLKVSGRSVNTFYEKLQKSNIPILVNDACRKLFKNVILGQTVPTQYYYLVQDAQGALRKQYKQRRFHHAVGPSLKKFL